MDGGCGWAPVAGTRKAAGMEFVRELAGSGKQVFLDMKFYDIGETVKRAVAQVAKRAGVRFLTVHGSGSVMRAAVEGKGSAPLELLAVTVLTSFDQSDLADLGYSCRISDLVELRVKKAMEAGIDDVGIGTLFGLYDWKFEMLAMQQHIQHLEDAFGVGPHTISVPRLEPAVGSDIAYAPPHRVSDEDFKKIVAILRLTVPYTGIIMSTRENAATRRATFAMGVSQISAGSRCDPGGYAQQSRKPQRRAVSARRPGQECQPGIRDQRP